MYINIYAFLQCTVGTNKHCHLFGTKCFIIILWMAISNVLLKDVGKCECFF